MALSDRDLIRDLSTQLAEAAQSDEQAYRRSLWRDVHSLRLPERPPVVCHPGCWEELLPRAGMLCQDPSMANLEYQMRQTLYKLSIGDDTVVEPWWEVHSVVELQGEHFWGLPINYVHPDSRSDGRRVAWHYVHPVREEADLDKIVPPVYRYNPQRTQEALEQAQELLGDILPVRQVTTIPTPGAWLHGWATQLCGVQELLLHMMDRPQWVHRLMSILRDGNLALLDQYEAMGILTLNNTGLWACDDLPQPDYSGPPARLKDMWGRGESQEFQGVGPAQYEEFLLEYQKPILARFGLTYYGCCEDLTNKIAMVLSVPNLRKFVCSPWTNLETLVDAIGDRWCIEWRQKATDVLFSFETQREHLRRGLTIAKGTPLHIVLQELETIDGRPERLQEWAALAKEMGASIA